MWCFSFFYLILFAVVVIGDSCWVLGDPWKPYSLSDWFYWFHICIICKVKRIKSDTYLTRFNLFVNSKLPFSPKVITSLHAYCIYSIASLSKKIHIVNFLLAREMALRRKMGGSVTVEYLKTVLILYSLSLKEPGFTWCYWLIVFFGLLSF